MRNLQLTPNQLNSIWCPQIIDITDQLPVNPEYTWAELAGTRELSALSTIVIHHDAWPKKNRAGVDDIAFAKEIANDHIELTKNEPKGDAGFPYHIWIRNGQAYQTNDILNRTYGVSNNNGYTVHVCLSGDYLNCDLLTDPDRQALYGAVIALIGQLTNFKVIKGHRELNNTSCPAIDMNQVRADILALQQKIIFQKSEAYNKETAFKIANQTMFLYNLAQGKQPDGSRADEGQTAWAVDMLLKMYPFMQENRLFG